MTLLDFCSRKSLVRLFFLFVMGFGLFCLNAGPQAKADFENNVAISVEAGRLTTQIRAESNANAYSVSASIAQFVAGQNHSCLLTSAGGVQCWGRNDSGQLGIGNTTHQSKPTDVVGLSSGIISLAAGDDHTCALTQLGGMNCWGQNDLGQIGDGTLINRMTPTDVTGLSTSVSQIIGGYRHTCALLTTGALKCWGNNNVGQLGDGTTTNRSVPTDVQGASEIAVSSLTAGGLHTCVGLTDGSAKCWGGNSNGQLGDKTTTDRLTPTTVLNLTGVSHIAAEGQTTCSLQTNGGVKCWGDNQYGQLGDGTTTDRSTPSGVSGLTSDVERLSLGDFHGCALLENGTLQCWGRNDYGQLGDGTTTQRTTPVTVDVALNLPICEAQSDLVTAECEILADLYNGTNGATWSDSPGWLTPNSSPCEWYGVVCTTDSPPHRVAELLLQSAIPN